MRRQAPPVRRVRSRRCWAYLLRCADGTYYAGCTSNLPQRLQLHNAGRGAKYLRGRRPAVLVYAKAYPSRARALRAEWRLKRLTHRQKARLIRSHHHD